MGFAQDPVAMKRMDLTSKLEQMINERYQSDAESNAQSDAKTSDEFALDAEKGKVMMERLEHLEFVLAQLAGDKWASNAAWMQKWKKSKK